MLSLQLSRFRQQTFLPALKIPQRSMAFSTLGSWNNSLRLDVQDMQALCFANMAGPPPQPWAEVHQLIRQVNYKLKTTECI